MILRLVISANPIERPEIRSLVEAIRKWENSTEHGAVTGILIQTEDIQISQAELDNLCAYIYPAGVIKAAEVHSEEEPPEKVLHLGERGVSIKGKMIGFCQSLSLTLGPTVSEAEAAALENSDSITLSRMGRG